MFLSFSIAVFNKSMAGKYWFNLAISDVKSNNSSALTEELSKKTIRITKKSFSLFIVSYRIIIEKIDEILTAPLK